MNDGQPMDVTFNNVLGWTVLPLFYGWVLEAMVCGGLDGLAAVLWVGVRCCGVWWVGRSCLCFMGGC